MANMSVIANIQVDPMKPVEEIKECIMLLANSHPGKQLEILKEIDLFIGETLAELERNKIAEEKSAEESKKTEVKM